MTSWFWCPIYIDREEGQYLHLSDSIRIARFTDELYKRMVELSQRCLGQSICTKSPVEATLGISFGIIRLNGGRKTTDQKGKKIMLIGLEEYLNAY